MGPPLVAPRRALALATAALVAGAAAAACTPAAVRAAGNIPMSRAYRPPAPLSSGAPAALPDAPAAEAPSSSGAPRYELLAGDLHCHVLPPDAPSEVARTLAETIDIAAHEGLDFVVLTPHVRSRFFQSAALREAVLAGREQLRAELARRAPSRTLFILGMEYTDNRYGHVGASFGDLEQVLREVPVSIALREPERFFERFVAHGGLLVVNHPLVTPLDSIFSMARADLSWRPFTAQGPFPAEIRAVHRLAQGFEAYNLSATQLRDRYLLGDTEHTIAATLARLDQEILAQGRRLIPVGGSDSHSHYLRATTFVLSEGRSEAAIRDALLAGRVCVRSPEACSLEVRPAPAKDAWVSVGGDVQGEIVEARVRGEDMEILVNGEVAARSASGAALRLQLKAGQCSVIRARAGESYSAPIYANCGFSPASPG